jgi:hypothetical protein
MTMLGDDLGVDLGVPPDSWAGDSELARLMREQASERRAERRRCRLPRRRHELREADWADGPPRGLDGLPGRRPLWRLLGLELTWTAAICRYDPRRGPCPCCGDRPGLTICGP